MTSRFSPVTPFLNCRPLDPIHLLIGLAESCDRSENAGFWILISASAHIDPNYNWAQDHEGSTAARLFWEKS